jgi:hypothetical protein
MRSTITLFAALLSTGCIDDPEEPALSESSSEINILGSWELSATTNNIPMQNIGPTADRTCFLRGVSGDLRGSPAQLARVEVIPQNGSWFINVKSGQGTGVKARVICVGVPYAQAVEFSWQDNAGNSVSAMVPNRRCFLRSVWTSIGLTQGNSNITVQVSGGFWTMNPTSFAAGVGVNRAGATAICIDKSAVPQGNFTHTGPGGGMSTIVTAVNTGGIACGLTAIAGIWANPNGLFGVEDGAYATNMSPTWKLTASNRKTGAWHCFR